MPPLIQKWNALKDEDKDLFPLLEVCIYLKKKTNYNDLYFLDYLQLRVGK